MLEILQFIFSSFWIWLGALVFVATSEFFLVALVEATRR